MEWGPEESHEERGFDDPPYTTVKTAWCRTDEPPRKVESPLAAETVRTFKEI